VRCPGCGRSWPASRFAGGRTLDCACGRRVAAAPPADPHPAPGPTRFQADAMLGALARWLRVLGIDTAYEAHIEDADLVRRAREEGRTILTRDRRLRDEWRVPDLVVLEADDPAVQLREVVDGFALRSLIRPFSRCLRCNVPLRAASVEEARGRVPERVLREQSVWRRCPDCGRVFWPGSHVRRMRARLESWLGPLPEAGREPGPGPAAGS